MKNKKEKDIKEVKDEMITEENLGEIQDQSRKYLEMFHKASTFNSERADAYAELMAFYQGNQHLLKKYESKQPWVVNMNTPYASVAIDNRVASLLANDYIGEILPLSPEDTESIEALSKLYQKEWERMNIDQKVRGSIGTGAVVRESYIHIYFDLDKKVGGTGKKRLGALEAYHIEPGQIFIDPTARKLRDAHYMFVAGRISKAEAKQKYPNLDSLLNGVDMMTPQERGEVYIDNDYVTEQDGLYSKLVCYEKGENGKTLRTTLIGGCIVEGPKEMPLKCIPIAQFRWKKAAQSCYGLSLMDEVLSLQKSICSIESAITNTALAYAAPSMMVRKGCGIDPKVASKANGAPGIVYAVDGDLNNAMRPVIPPKVDETILNIKTDYEQKIDKITGNSNQFLGNIGTAGNTSSGAKVAVERAKIIEIDVLNNIAEFVEDLTNILIEYIMYIYEGETVTAYDGKEADGKTFKFVDIDVPKAEKMKDLQYKYYIELDTKTPYSKERQKELMLEIFTLERQYDTPVKTVTVTDIIKNSDLENKDEIIQRFNQINKQDATTKAEAIEQLMMTGMEIGVPNELITQAIAEIISGQGDTPAVDEIMKMAEEVVQAEMQQAEQKLGSATNVLMNAPGVDQQVNDMVAQSGMGSNLPAPEMGMEQMMGGQPQMEGPATQELLSQITPEMIGL